MACFARRFANINKDVRSSMATLSAETHTMKKVMQRLSISIDAFSSTVKGMLEGSAAWKRCGGHDHLTALGRTGSNFKSSVLSHWHGGTLFSLEQKWWANVTKLTVDPK